MPTVTFEDVQNARARIAGRLSVTPLDYSTKLSLEGTQVYYKLECQQKLKSFKCRGALSKVASLTPQQRAKGVLAVSSGNHGAGVALAARLEGVAAVQVYVPTTTPLAKTDKIEQNGAQVVRAGDSYDECHSIAMEALAQSDCTFVDPCSDREVIAGQGTIGLEILEQNPQIDTILVPIGGGGIISGISVAAKKLKPGIRVIGVQTAACPAMVAALRDKVCYLEYPCQDSVCDALLGGVGEIPYEMAGQCIDDIIVVQEEEIKRAAAFLLAEEKIVAECAGAVGVAAFLQSPQRFAGQQVAIVITGGNLDKGLMTQLLTDYT